jgi:hypothetical protein
VSRCKPPAPRRSSRPAAGRKPLQTPAVPSPAGFTTMLFLIPFPLASSCVIFRQMQHYFSELGEL